MGVLENTKMLLKKQGKTQVDLCNHLGLPKQAFTDWNRGKSESYTKYIREIAEYLGVSVADLYYEKIKDIVSAQPVPQQTMLPVYGEVSAGSGEFAQQLILGYEVADAKYDPKEYFYLLVDGDSMSPLIDDGDYVLVHSQETIESGQIAVCVVDGFGYVKKVERTEDSITLISINPYYPPRTFKRYDMNRVRIYGRVLEMKRKF